MAPERRAALDVSPSVRLEARIAIPSSPRAGVVLCHPHPLYGGTMDHPVVLCLADAAARQGLATLRFNFRGVGASTGAHDDGRGERDDVTTAAAYLAAALAPSTDLTSPRRARIALAGYSFGAAMAALAASPASAGLALIAPPVLLRPLPAARLRALSSPVLLLAGAEDPYCPPAALEALAAGLPQADVRVLVGVDHFFVDGLERVAAAVAAWADAVAVPR